MERGREGTWVRFSVGLDFLTSKEGGRELFSMTVSKYSALKVSLTNASAAIADLYKLAVVRNPPKARTLQSVS